MTTIPTETLTLIAKKYGVQVGISRIALETARTRAIEDALGTVMLQVHGFLYGESLLTEERRLPFSTTVTTWGHTGPLVAWYAPWWGRRWEPTTITVHGEVTVKAEHFSAFPDLPYRPPDWGQPIRMVTTDVVDR